MRKALLFLPLLLLLIPIVNAGITYSAPTITLTGGTYNFTDIYAADVAGGWGVVFDNDGTGRQYEFNARIVVGDGTVGNAANLTDTDKQITFKDILTSSSQSDIYVTRYSTMVLGVLVNETQRIVRSGCQILSLEGTASTYIIRGDGSALNVYLYASTISHVYSAVITYLSNPGRIWGCSLIGPGVSGTRPDASCYDTIIYNRYTAMLGVTWGTDNLLVLNSKNCIVASTPSSTFRGVEYRGLGDFLMGHKIDAWHYIVDCEAPEPWTVTWGTFYSGGFIRQYTWNTLIKDNNGLPIQNANVILYRANGTQAFNVLTAVDGTIVEQTVSRGFYNQTGGATLYDSGPFNLTVTAPGYINHSINNITLTEPIDWEIALTPLPGAWSLLQVITIIFTALAIAIWRYR